MDLRVETLVRHELVGLDARIVSGSDPGVVGTEGEVVTETTETLGIKTSDGVIHVPKDSATFEWTLPSGERVRTSGERLIARPARRTEQTGDSKWR